MCEYANLLLARSVSRRRELAMRAALGASRGRLIRQSLTECLLLSGGGAAVGCGIAWTLLQIFKMLAPVSIPRLQQAELDIGVLLFTVVVTLVCGIAFALPSALANPEPELLTSGSRTTGSSRTKLRHLLTMAQIAVSLVLLSVAGLLIKSLWNLQNVVSGIDAEHVVAADITVGPRSYPNAASRQRFFDTLAEQLRSLPGIKAVAMSDTAPPNGFVHTRPFGALQAMGKPAPDSYLSGGIVAWRSVSPDYFRALGIQILNGRGFREEETKSKDNVIVISTSLAHGLFQNQDPIGKALKVGPQSPIFTVVGVVADVKNNGLSQNADPEYYLPRKQITDPNIGRDESMVGRAVHAYDGEAFVIVRSSARTEAMANWIRSETAAMDPAVPATISTMQRRIRADSERPRFSAILLSFFAFVGVVLAALGLYGLISFLVEQRTQEIGVRMAVGATRVQVAGLILWHTLRWSLGGVVVGLAAVVVLARSLRSLVFHVPVENPILFGSMVLLMLVVAALAALRPALQVANIDPMAALRRE
jgi:putative ABC transport system permease protein